ncbi:hypothetical protein B5M09_000562 [Aphanomyces astaci]|uniref:Tyrosine specific protein phosphatases domain-containing protein n=1 Tax=Aphanomyces astaci TaxID=112090 RepID=A0A425DJP5_APHAT|nr:hypothetical protein B5M09_000562 [Aphanomyces astaci]
MGQQPSSSRDSFGIVPSEPPANADKKLPPQHVNVDDPPSRKERLAVCAPILSAIRPWLFVAGHGVVWPKQSHSLINLASEVPFLEDNPPPPHIHSVLTLALRDGATQEILPFLPRVLETVQTQDNVIVMCQQGVSRSCATAIAILMCRESMSYASAFADVKAARDVCSPNAGFICQLMELHAQRQDQAKRPRVYRFVPHALHDLATNVLKPCWLTPHARIHATPAQVRRRSNGIYVYSESPLTVFLWRGQDATDANVTSATTEVHLWYLHLWGETTMPSVIVEREGAESAAFLSFVQPAALDDATIDFDDVSWTEPPRTRQVEDDLAPSDGLLDSSRKPQLRVIESVDDESWELLQEYDSSDLVPNQVGWLHVPGDRDYIWLGKACKSSWTYDVLVQRVQRDPSIQAGPITISKPRPKAKATADDNVDLNTLGPILLSADDITLIRRDREQQLNKQREYQRKHKEEEKRKRDAMAKRVQDEVVNKLVRSEVMFTLLQEHKENNKLGLSSSSR